MFHVEHKSFPLVPKVAQIFSSLRSNRISFIYLDLKTRPLSI
jgi:hypothetical protein